MNADYTITSGTSASDIYTDGTTASGYTIIHGRLQGKTHSRQLELDFELMLEVENYYNQVNYEDQEKKIRKWKRLMKSMYSMKTTKCLNVKYKSRNKSYRKRKLKK